MSRLPRLPRLEYPELTDAEKAAADEAEALAKSADVIYDIYEDGTGHYWADDPRVDKIMRSYPTPDECIKALEEAGFRVVVRRPSPESAHRAIAEAMAESRKKIN